MSDQGVSGFVELLLSKETNVCSFEREPNGRKLSAALYNVPRVRCNYFWIKEPMSMLNAQLTATRCSQYHPKVTRERYSFW